MSASLDLQKALRAQLVASPELMALVPADHVLDRGGRPERFPCIILGEAQEIAEDRTLDREHVRVVATVHVWARESGIIVSKQAANAIRQAVLEWAPVLDDHHVVDLRHVSSRYMRDPDGETSNAVLVIEALLQERRP